MKPITPVFPSAPGTEELCVWAKTQSQYINLPSVVSADGMVTTRWALTLRERIRLLIHGSLWLQILTFNTPLQPVKLLVREPCASPTGDWQPKRGDAQPKRSEAKFGHATSDGRLVVDVDRLYRRKQQAPEVIPSDEAIADALHRQVQLGHPIGSALKNLFPPE